MNAYRSDRLCGRIISCFPLRLNYLRFIVFLFFIICCNCDAHGFHHDLPNADKKNIEFVEAVRIPTKSVYIPFRLSGQLMLVEATVDSLKGSFIFDTGSEHIVLNAVHFKKAVNAQNTSGIGNTGILENVYRQTIDSISLEALSLHSLPVHLTDLSHIENKKNTRLLGIIGYEVLQHFEVMIDYPSRYILLIPVDRKGVRLDSTSVRVNPIDSVTFELRNHLAVLPAMVNQVKVKMILDSGAELNLIDRKVKRRVLDKFTIVKRINMTGVGQHDIEVLAGTLHDVWCGSQFTQSMNTILTNLDEFNDKIGILIDGVLGVEFLKSRRVLIQYQKRKLYFYEPERS